MGQCIAGFPVPGKNAGRAFTGFAGWVNGASNTTFFFKRTLHEILIVFIGIRTHFAAYSHLSQRLYCHRSARLECPSHE